MGIGTRITDFVRDVFRRDDRTRQEAAGGVNMGDFPVDMFGNLSVQTLSHGILQDYLTLNNALMARFIDYERMDEYADCNAALNIYADDSTLTDMVEQHVMWTVCKDESIKRTLDTMLHKKIHVDDEAWGSIRILCKYGNCFEEILADDKGVQGLNYLPAPTVRRLENDHGALEGFVQSFRGTFAVKPIGGNVTDFKFVNGVGKDPQSGVVLFEPWRIVHMRLRSERRRAMYGVGLLEAARWVWKRLTLLEDAALISRLSRAPSRFAFYVDVGKLPPERAEKYLDQIRQAMKKRKFVNPRTGQLDLRYSPLATDEDFYLPVRESREIVRADVLNTPQWTGVEDVEYFRNKLHAALMVPRAYLGYDENMPSRATLSQEDVRFARSVLRVQREYRSALTKVARVHLAILGIDPSYVDFKLGMAVPSAIFELAQLEVQNMRAQFALSMQEFVSKHWILSRVFNLSDAEIEMVFAQKADEKRAANKLEQEAMAAQMAIQTSGGTGGGRFESRQFPAAPKAALQERAAPRQLTPGRSKLYPLEQDLFRGGNVASERRAEEKLNRILQENRGLAMQLASTQSMMSELKSSLAANRLP